ncbi:MAG TPA: Wzz/FepE/Etk N-terminal domain-containing protein, partial [Gammaproteobacteria bacterium]
MNHQASDEIDLIELWGILRRHARLFIGVSLSVLVAGLVYAALYVPRYDYNVTIQIGGMRDKSAFDLIDKPQSVISALKESIIPEVISKYAATHPNSPISRIKIDAINPLNSDVVVLTARGTADQQADVTSLLNTVVTSLDASHGSLLKLRIDATKKLLLTEISDANAQVVKLVRSRDEITRKGGASDQALTLLLLDDQISKLQTYLFNLRQQLEVGLVADVRMTKEIAPPQRSVTPSGISRSIIVVLTVLLSVFVAIFFVFLSHFFQLAKE